MKITLLGMIALMTAMILTLLLGMHLERLRRDTSINQARNAR
jgi:hypothetical protein